MAIKGLERRPDDSAMHVDRLRIIDAKLGKVADAIESVGISETLAARLSRLEREKAETEKAMKQAPAREKYRPGVAPHLVDQMRKLAENIETIAADPRATQEEVEAVRSNLAAQR